MQHFKLLSIPLYRYAIFVNLRYFHTETDPIVIVAAARTPWGKYKGQLASVSGWQLSHMAVEAAVKQSAIPIEQIEQIFMNETPPLQKDNGTELIFSYLLKKAVYFVGDDESKTKFFLQAMKYIKSQHQSAVVVGGLESASQKEFVKNKYLEYPFNEISSEMLENHLAKSVIRYSKSQTEAAFDSEIVPLTIQQQEDKRIIIREITQDEILPENCVNCGDGAAALVLTTSANARQLSLSPLAVIKGFEYLRNTSSNVLSCSKECVEKLLSKIKLHPQQIQHWEIEDYFPQLQGFLQHHFNLNLDLINPHGGSLILGYSPAVSLPRLLTHLTHSLNPLEYGCVICSTSQASLVLIIQKLTLSSNQDRLPLVTLYTKYPCPLCDVLVEELKTNFSGEYELEKIFIDTKDNLRFLRLYRHDIPVVFLNKQFLCMHRLNHRLLRKRLDLLKKINM